MLQNPRKTLGYTKNMVYKIPPGGGGKPYPASGLIGHLDQQCLIMSRIWNASYKCIKTSTVKESKGSLNALQCNS